GPWTNGWLGGRVATILPPGTSRTTIGSLAPAEATHLPSGENATSCAIPCLQVPSTVFVPVATSQSSTSDWAAAARVLPSGLKATDSTGRGAVQVLVAFPVATSHRMIALSWAPEASVLPSGLKAMEWIHSVCPVSVSFGCAFEPAGSPPFCVTLKHAGSSRHNAAGNKHRHARDQFRFIVSSRRPRCQE